MRNRERWVKIVAAALAFMMLLPVIALLIGSTVGGENSLDAVPHTISAVASLVGAV